MYQPLNKKLPVVEKNGFVRSELFHGNYLPRVKPLLENERYGTYEEKENYVLRVEEVAETYYQSLWNSFSNSEKHLLYDLAKDRFVNLKNLSTIRILMQKGVIVAEDTLTIMNRSFNNFILSVVNEDEESKMERELHEKRTMEYSTSGYHYCFGSIGNFHNAGATKPDAEFQPNAGGYRLCSSTAYSIRWIIWLWSQGQGVAKRRAYNHSKLDFFK